MCKAAGKKRFSANTTIPQVDNAVQGIYVVTKNLSFAAYFGGTVTNLILR